MRKRMWLDQLNQVAVGAQQGSEHGGWLQVLEEQLMVQEECNANMEPWRVGGWLHCRRRGVQERRKIKNLR